MASLTAKTSRTSGYPLTVGLGAVSPLSVSQVPIVNYPVYPPMGAFTTNSMSSIGTMLPMTPKWN